MSDILINMREYSINLRTLYARVINPSSSFIYFSLINANDVIRCVTKCLYIFYNKYIHNNKYTYYTTMYNDASITLIDYD